MSPLAARSRVTGGRNAVNHEESGLHHDIRIDDERGEGGSRVTHPRRAAWSLGCLCAVL